MRKLYFLLLSMGVLTACDKLNDGPAMDYPITFVSKQLKNTTPVRMYTKNGEVKDAQRAKAFAEKWGNWYHLEDEVAEVRSVEELTFKSKTEAEYRNGSTVDNFEVKGSGNELVLTSKEEFTAMYNFSDEHYYKVSAGISKYKPIVYDMQALAPGSGGAYYYKSKAQLFGQFKEDELHVYKMVFTLKSGTKDAFFRRTTSTSNRFDVSGLSLLRDSDTLVVQEFVGVAVKKK